MSNRDHPTMAEGGRKKGKSKTGRRLTQRESLAYCFVSIIDNRGKFQWCHVMIIIIIACTWQCLMNCVIISSSFHCGEYYGGSERDRRKMEYHWILVICTRGNNGRNKETTFQ